MNIVSRTFLSEPESSTSSSIFCFHGKPDYSDPGKEEFDSFVEISDCRTKIRIHKQSGETLENYVERLKTLNLILAEHIDKLKKFC